MKRWLFAAPMIVAFTSTAWAEVRWGQEGSMGDAMFHAGELFVDPIYLVSVIVSLLIASRFVHWSLIPIGGVAGAAVVTITSYFLNQPNPRYLDSATFWAAAIGNGIILAFVLLLILRASGSKE